MSLINEALKKVQRQRTAVEPAPPLPGGNGGPAPRKRGRALPTQTLLLIVAGAAVLIVVSVVLTIFLVRSEPGTTEPTAPVTAKADAPADAPAATAPAPVITLPKIEVPVITPEPEPVVAAPEPAVETKPAPEAKTVGPTPPVYDERVYAFIDRLQVMGIRSSGSDSKVLMNDRVYRVNDIVERSLGLKLMEVTSDSLIFIDPSGATYTKNF
ncbi:MAG: hypothetical protein H3C27_09395 [Opitutaceae bacterium]|nr:hypothetical protein [Opitutaceae bacterium]